jgi:hypothetical protein
MEIVNHIPGIFVGDRVRWESCEGTKRGEVMQIFSALDSYGDNINFYHIAYGDGFDGRSMAMISEDRLHEIEFKVFARDWELEADRNDYERMFEV